MLTGGVIGGLKQEGNYKIDARFNRDDLIDRIDIIGKFRSRIKVKNMDALKYITNYINKLSENTLVYLDPPYFLKGQHLYMNHYKKEDHILLRDKIIKCLNRNWVLSYDADSEILKMYSGQNHFTYSLRYSAASSYEGTEAFFFDDRINIPTSSKISYVQEGLEQLMY